MFAAKLQTFPNRETRVTFYSVPGVKDRDKKPKSPEETANVRIPKCVPPERESEGGRLLDIISKLRDALPEGFSTGKPGFGGLAKPTKFGNNARRTLLRAGGSLGTLEGGDKRCLFLTGTLPGGTETAMLGIAMYSSYIVDRLKTWLHDNGASHYSMYVWERQKRGALHLHYVAYLDTTEKGNRIYHGFKQYWYRLLCTVSDKSGIDLFARSKGGTWRRSPKVVQAKAVWCTRSVAAYLSKYLGKNTNKERAGGWASALCPVRWWGVSRPLLALLRSQTFERVYYTMNRRDAENFYIDVSSWLENTSDKCYSYTHKYTRSCVTVAYNTLNKGELIWEAMRTQQMRARDLNMNVKDLELTTTRLKSMMRRYSLTTHSLSQLLGTYCAQVAAKLQRSNALSLAEAVELSNGFHFYLTWKFRDRLKRPQSLSEDLEWLENSLSLMLRELREARQAVNRKNGIHG